MIMIQRDFCNFSSPYQQTIYIINVKKDSDDIHLYMIYLFTILCSMQLAILQRLRNLKQAENTVATYEVEQEAEDPLDYD